MTVNFEWSDWDRKGPGDYYWMCRNCHRDGNVSSEEACRDAYYGHTCNGGVKPRRPS